MPGIRRAGGGPAAKGVLIGDAVSTVVPVELSDAALAAEVTDGLALVEGGLRAAARAQHDLLDQTSAYLIDAGGSGSGRRWCCWPPSSATPGTSGSCPPPSPSS